MEKMLKELNELIETEEIEDELLDNDDLRIAAVRTAIKLIIKTNGIDQAAYIEQALNEIEEDEVCQPYLFQEELRKIIEESYK